MLAKRVQKFSSGEILEFMSLAAKLPNAINLSIGIPFAETSRQVKEATIEALEANQTKYTEASGISILKDAIAKKLKDKNKIDAKADQVIVTEGVSAGIFLAMGCLLDPGDEVIIPDPFFLAYREIAALLDAKPVYVPTYPDFNLTREKIAPYITNKTKAIIINTPNNPSGAVYSKEDLTDIAKIAKEYNLYIITDEVYEDYVYQGSHFSIGSIYEKTITLNGFSKGHAMTGFRLGYAYVPKELEEPMKELQQFVFFSNPSLSQYAALAALSESVQKTIEYHKKARKVFLDLLDPNYEVQGGNGSFFLFIKHPSLSGREVYEKALTKNLIVMPGSIFSNEDTHFRVSFSAALEKIKTGAEILNTLI